MSLSDKMAHEHVAWNSNASLTAEELQIMGKEAICCICDDLEDTDMQFTVLSCNHVFHIGCAARWLQQTNNCPMCRAENCKIQSIDFARVYQDFQWNNHSMERACVICTCDEQNKTCAKTACGHEFHFSCITRWIGIRRACPLCNRGGDSKLFLQMQK